MKRKRLNLLYWFNFLNLNDDLIELEEEKPNTIGYPYGNKLLVSQRK